MQPTKSLAWYKQFWPWFLIIVPLTSMILSFTMMHLAFNTDDSMVIDDYYKEGKGINVKLQAIQKAKELGIVTQMSISQHDVEVNFLSGKPENGEALILDFHHSTQDFKDFSVNLFKDANGIYRAPLAIDISGKWKVTLRPFTTSWKIQHDISLPREGSFEFKP